MLVDSKAVGSAWIRLFAIQALACLLLYGLWSSHTQAADLNWKGDFRYRTEYIDNTSTRFRQRIRLRLGADAKISDAIMVGAQLASGSTDPISTNQTLNSSFSTKTIGIDLAFFKWNLASDRFTLMAGKMKNPFKAPGKTELVWDSDLRPEGMDVAFAQSWGKYTLGLDFAVFWVDESSSARQFLYSLYSRHHLDMAMPIHLHAGIFAYTNTPGSSPANLLNFGVEFWVIKKALAIVGDYVTNSDASTAKTGYLFGLMWGKAKKKGSWGLRANYRRVEASAVNFSFSDSDFAGGGTAGKGFEFGGDYAVADFAKLGLTWFMNSQTVAGSLDYNRGQLDIAMKF